MPRLPRSVTASVVVPAPADAVWEVLVDIGRIGEWSHEARGARWVTGVGPAVGNVFRGTNRLGSLRWARACTVLTADVGQRFAYRTDGGLAGDRTEWSFELTPAEGGTRVTERYQILRMPRLLEAAVVRLMPSHLDRTAALVGDLERLGALAALSS
ncbi:MAG: Hemerythrin cation binding domain protein [Marmoricola sp.]|nr:Hemerythrin cation binding domain protein [Marmoricola sp.]